MTSGARGSWGSNARRATSTAPSNERATKTGTNRTTSNQLKCIGATNTKLMTNAATTAGTPSHQADATPSVSTHQINENTSPRDASADQFDFLFNQAIDLFFMSYELVQCNFVNFANVFKKTITQSEAIDGVVPRTYPM